MKEVVNTRNDILNKAFPLVYQKGYQATSVDEIIALTKVTKGAFYYHFKSKDEMGLAMIREILARPTGFSEMQSLDPRKAPSSQIYGMMKGLLDNESFFKVQYGCPIVSLIEEMAPLETKFADELRKLFSQWRSAIISYLDQAKDLNTITTTRDSEQIADFVIMGYSGARNLGKIWGKISYESYLNELKKYLKQLD